MSFDATSTSQWLLQATATAASIASIVLVIIVWQQLKQTQHEMNSRLRPWVGTKQIIISEEKIVVEYENYGELPALSIIEKSVLTSSVVSVDKIKAEKETYVGVIMPHGDKILTLELAKNALNESLYFGFLIEYTYPKKRRGEYGMIARLDEANRRFETLQEWSY